MQSTATEEVVDSPLTASPETKFKLIKVNDIKILDRKRDIVEARVRALNESIKEIGLEQPIVVSEDNILIAGRHRYEVYKINNWENIPAVVKNYNEIDAELAEIDENLVRFELTDMERSMQYARRKVLYATKYPRKAEERRKLAEEMGSAESSDDDGDAESPGNRDSSAEKRDSFVVDTSKKTGRSTSQIRDEAKLGEALIEELTPEIRSLIAPTKVAENKSDLKRLLDEPDEDVQLEVARLVNEAFESGKNLSVSEALRQVNGTTTYEATVSEKGEATLNSALKKNLRILELSVNSATFVSTAETWTVEGIEDIREDLYRIEALASRGATMLTEVLDKKAKLGQV